MQSIIREETDCKSALAPAAVLAGYSEGGYSSVAIADALSSGLGVDIISVQSGAGPYKIGSVTLTKVLENMQAGTYPPSQYYLMLLIASSFSSANPMVENYQQGQDLLADKRKTELLELIKRGGSNSEFNSFVNNDDPTDMFDANLTAWAFESIAAGNYDPCSFRLEKGFNDKLCEALASNDLTDILLNVNYPVQMCQSPDDEIVTALNVPDIEENDFLSLSSVTGNHNQAGGLCLLQALAFLGGSTVSNYPILELHSSGGCQAKNRDPEQNLSPPPTPATSDQNRLYLTMPVILQGFTLTFIFLSLL
jgi:hypothetical protein